MNKNQHIYIRVLLWAYNKKISGFTRAQLNKELDLNKTEQSYVTKIFFNRPNGDSPVFFHTGSSDGEDYYELTDKGVSSAVDYLELQQAIKGGRTAMLIAIISILISIIVGVVQILVQLKCN